MIKFDFELHRRVYWFLRNLSAFVLCMPCYLIHVPYIMLQSILFEIVNIFKCNGRSVLEYPWKWNWKWEWKN